MQASLKALTLELLLSDAVQDDSVLYKGRHGGECEQKELNC